MSRPVARLAATTAACVLAAGGAGCQKLHHRTGQDKLPHAMSKAFKRAYAASYRMTTGRPRSRIIRFARATCRPRGPEPTTDRDWPWTCRILWIRRDRPGAHLATYGVRVDMRGCFQASSASFPARLPERVLHRPARNPLIHFRSCP
jgi:hypothetical protein